MDMEGLGTEGFVGSSNNVNDATHIAKGKRTKRLRLLAPCGVNVAAAATATAMTSSSSSASGDHLSGGADYGSFSSTTTSNTYESTDQDEEDMANCLILLAQGGGRGEGGEGDARHHHKKQVEDRDHDSGSGNTNKTVKGNTSSRRFAEMATATSTATKIGFYIYECKTCNRTFPSFQALGGHRASHKKPKVTVEEKQPPPPPPPPPPPQPQLVTGYDQFQEAAAGQSHIKSGPPISLQLGSHSHSHRAFHGNKAKIHECSICGSEFTSGQALGGHMRRHRASTNTSTQAVVMGMMSAIETSCDTKAAAVATAAEVEVQPRNILQLDLNLPAPEDELREPKFQFSATQKSMVLSAAPALVGCHY